MNQPLDFRTGSSIHSMCLPGPSEVMRFRLARGAWWDDALGTFLNNSHQEQPEMFWGKVVAKSWMLHHARLGWMWQESVKIDSNSCFWANEHVHFHMVRGTEVKYYLTKKHLQFSGVLLMFGPHAAVATAVVCCGPSVARSASARTVSIWTCVSKRNESMRNTSASTKWQALLLVGRRQISRAGLPRYQ